MLDSRTWLTVALLTSVLAMSDPHRNAPRQHAAAADAMVFEFLTRNQWVAGHHTLQFGRDGRYRWYVVSDHLEHDESGRWNFKLSGDSAGCIWLSEGGVVRFAKVGAALRVRRDRFGAGATLHDDPAATRKGAANLAAVPDPPLYARLLSTAWKPAGRLAMRSAPARVVFTSDGRMTETDERGACVAVSGFDLTGGVDLLVDPESESCPGEADGPKGHAGTMGRIHFEDRLLFYEGVPDEVYRPIDDLDSTQIVAADVRGLRIRAVFPPRLDPGKPFAVWLALQNQGQRPRRLERVGLGHSKRERDSLGFVPIAARDYPGSEIDPGAWLRDTLVVTLDAAQMESTPRLYVRSRDSTRVYDEWISLPGLGPP